jgi:hypothetical protein
MFHSFVKIVTEIMPLPDIVTESMPLPDIVTDLEIFIS